MSICMKKEKNRYHHGNLAESLLDAVDEIATQFGLEAVTLRACAKLVGVSPSSAFRHYADKRALFTAFATRALQQLTTDLEEAKDAANAGKGDAFQAVSLAYIQFALRKPAFFRAMWREETIYASDEHYVLATSQLQQQLQGGFADTITDHDPESLSEQELLVWSAVHGLANLFVDGPIGKGATEAEKLKQAEGMVLALRPALH